MLPTVAMPSTHLVSAKPARRVSHKGEAQFFPVSTPSPIVAEINGYIAVRDQLLEAAEEQPTTEALRRRVVEMICHVRDGEAGVLE